MSSKQPQTSLFQVYLRLRPPITNKRDESESERFLVVEPPEISENDRELVVPVPTHVTLQPPSDSRKRAIERFGFTKVFEEITSQLDVFHDTCMESLVRGVLKEGRDGLVATLGVTGSGKSHTILGSKSERGITQMALDVIFRSLEPTLKTMDNSISPMLLASLAASDAAESQLFSAQNFLEAVYGEFNGRSSRAQTPMSPSRANTPLTEPTPALVFPRRQARDRPSPLPRLPDMSHLAVELNPKSDYMVLVSMYEVYNDRIYDLLSPAINSGQGNMSRGNAQKDRRRPLLFKSTEASPDQKLVSGLRKIACSTYEDALHILDIGLTERKVTGTGANSVSSRSHGFFCLEVKRKSHSLRDGEPTWVSNTLTVVDLAGSERARTAKTAGATLAEAGKINESLMYLGQCLQMQSHFQDGAKTALVPFRQCKLTELLFSNSFPSSNQMSRGLHPQKAIMIVTADPLGDFNATSQILRYSALAREVTVPRVPSLTGSIVSATSFRDRRSAATSASGRTTPFYPSSEELEQAMAEVARLTKDCHTFAVRLAEEEIARSETEMRLRAAEDRAMNIEQDVREECWAEMDEMMEQERRRWQNAWDEQIGRNNEHVDRKIELVSRGFSIYEDPEPSANERIEELEDENERLRSRLAILEREMNSQSPTRKPRPHAQGARSANILGRESDIQNAMQRMNQLHLTDGMFATPSKSPSPEKKPRNMSTRKHNLGPENEI